MKCFVCDEPDVFGYTECCWQGVCRLCSTEFDEKCLCGATVSISPFGGKVSELNNNFQNEYQKFLDFISNPPIWKVKVSLETWVESQNKNIQFTQDALDRIQKFETREMYVKSIPEYRFTLPGILRKKRVNNRIQTVLLSQGFLEFVFHNNDLPWNWDWLVMHPEIILDDILNLFPTVSRISFNPNLTFQDVLAHPRIKWNWDSLSSDGRITIQDVLDYPDLPWNWYEISQNPNISYQDVKAHPELPWNWISLCLNPNITLQDVITNPRKEWDWRLLSAHLVINISDALAFPLDWVHFSMNPNNDPKDIFAHPELPWNWEDVSQNPHLTMQDVIKDPDKWSWEYLSVNRGITIKDVIEHPELPWSGHYLSQNPNVTLQDVIDNPQLPWDWKILSYHLPITFQDVLDHPELPWDWHYLSGNPLC